MADKHLVVEDAGLGLPAVDDHRLFVDCSCVVLSCARAKSGRFTLSHAPLVRIELEQLVGALTHLALLVEHEAATKHVDLALIRYGCVALAALDDFGASVRDALPNDLIAVDLRSNNLLTNVVVEAADKVHVVTYCGQSRALSGCWHPLGVVRNLYIQPETFSLLHALDVGLQAAYQFVD